MTERKLFLGLCLLAVACPPVLAEKETEYLAVFMEGKKVGYAIHARTEEGAKVTTSEEVSITISRLGFPITVKMTETSVETTAGKPLGFQSVQDLGAMVMKIEGTIGADGTVTLTSSAMGTTEKSTMQWPAGALLAEGLRLLTLEKGLEPGTRYTARVFSPGVMQAVHGQVVIGPRKEVDLLGRVVTLTEMTNTLNLPGTGPVTTTSYVDEETRVLKSIMPIAGMVVEMVSCPKEFALGDNDVLEVVDRMFLKSPEPIENVGSASAIMYVLNPVEGAELVIPSTDNQTAKRLSNGRIVLVVEPATATGGTFPYRGNDPELREAVKPTRFLQSDRREIVALARKVVGDTRDATEATRRIESFVADYIDNKSLSVGYASAAEVLESRQGDCSEFAVLTAALCRAVGIPAQVAVGVAYVKDFGGIEGFGGHAWTQAYVGADARGRGGTWIGLDAAFKGSGRGGYDAGHIALAVGNGEPGDFFNMASALGQFKIERLEVRRTR